METDLKTRQDLRLFVTMVPTFMRLKVLKTNRRRAIVLIAKVILRYPNKFLQLKNAFSMILESFLRKKRDFDDCSFSFSFFAFFSEEAVRIIL